MLTRFFMWSGSYEGDWFTNLLLVLFLAVILYNVFRAIRGVWRFFGWLCRLLRITKAKDES